MKNIISLVVLAVMAIQTAHAREIVSTREDSQVNVARVVRIISLVSKPGLRVAIAVQDNGGSTDFSPTQTAFFTLYSKGEMFSTDASFNLGPVFSVKSAKRISGGIYTVDVQVANERGELVKKTLTINAVKAITALESIRCEDFDCEASTQFKSTITVD